ncbi:DUF2510 domain-containing protein [Mycobacterium sp. RTGN5]|uniref:DUF2510 domain-containing protein n=1 Tax=Mycobacterium sp. RTGN5 TaxID=3016522 RepID=UPI0029C788BB|nr:DUF2510 domain-containing protein [Mycobacterium sp. RTGN5]
MRATVICANGHQNPDGQYFCGECGDLLEPGAVICLAGHANPDDRRFCGECGAPLVAPAGVTPAASTARWSVDPTGRHQCRYWDGATWTQHVADGGTLGTDPEPRAPGWRAESWVALIAGLITVGLLAAAGADIWVQLSRDAANPSAVGQSSTTTPTSTGAASSSAPPPPSVVVATPCQPGGNGVAADGSATYCERLADTDRYLWSLNPGDIPSPAVGQGGDPAVGVCMVQTGRTEADCVEYLQPAR